MSGQSVLGELGAVRLSAVRIASPRRDVDADWYRVELPVRGRLTIEQAGRRATLDPGDFILLDRSRPACRATTQHALALSFPRRLLPLPEDQVARVVGVPIPGDHGTAALFSSLARQAVGHLDDYGPADAARLGTTLIDLLGTALAAHLQRGFPLPPQSQQRAQLQRVHAFVEERLGDPRLSPAMIAAGNYISLRYLYKLFETEQLGGVAAWIRQRRLERCRRDLLDPALADRTVGGIAARWGLNDPASFSRAFRGAYGLPPLEYRRTKAAPSRLVTPIPPGMSRPKGVR